MICYYPPPKKKKMFLRKTDCLKLIASYLLGT